MKITTREALERWTFEMGLIREPLARIERVERAILTKLGCPTDPVAIYALLAGERPAPWPTRTAARDKPRALHAMYTLAFVAQARSYLALGDENPRLAARAALMAGLYAGDAALNAVLRETTRRGGRTRGDQITLDAQREDRAIVRHVRQWAMSDELQDQYRSAAAYVCAKIKLPLRTIQRSMKRLGLSNRKPRQ